MARGNARRKAVQELTEFATALDRTAQKLGQGARAAGRGAAAAGQGGRGVSGAAVVQAIRLSAEVAQSLEAVVGRVDGLVGGELIAAISTIGEKIQGVLAFIQTRETAAAGARGVLAPLAQAGVPISDAAIDRVINVEVARAQRLTDLDNRIRNRTTAALGELQVDRARQALQGQASNFGLEGF